MHLKNIKKNQYTLTITKYGPTQTQSICCGRTHVLHHFVFYLLQDYNEERQITHSSKPYLKIRAFAISEKSREKHLCQGIPIAFLKLCEYMVLGPFQASTMVLFSENV